jgi:hypothetical protein
VSSLSETLSNLLIGVGREKCVSLLGQTNVANSSILFGTSRPGDASAVRGTVNAVAVSAASLLPISINSLKTLDRLDRLDRHRKIRDFLRPTSRPEAGRRWPRLKPHLGNARPLGSVKSKVKDGTF